MSFLALYFILLKATLSAFSGLGALPIIRDELVINRRAISDAQMNTALVAGRVSPGPIGMYIVSIGYYAGGSPGAVAAWLALITPALLVVPILRYLGARADHPVVRDALSAVVIASVGLTLGVLFPLAITSVTGPLTAAAGLTGFVYILWRSK